MNDVKSFVKRGEDEMAGIAEQSSAVRQDYRLSHHLFV